MGVPGAKSSLDQRGEYLNWDVARHRQIAWLKTLRWSFSTSCTKRPAPPTRKGVTIKATALIFLQFRRRPFGEQLLGGFWLRASDQTP